MPDQTAILIVDDDQLVCQLISKVISRRGLDCVQVSSGQEAINLFRIDAGRFSTAIVDLIMPNGPNGWDVIDFISTMVHRPNVIVLTGARISMNEEQKLYQKADAIIRKQDFTLDLFNQTLDTLPRREES